MKAAPSSCRVSTKRMSFRPYISVTMLLGVVPTRPKVYSTPSARNASSTAWPAFIAVSLMGTSAAEALLEELVHRVAAELGALENRMADTGEHLLEARADLTLPDLLGALLDPPGRLVDLRLVGGTGSAGGQGQNHEACDRDPWPARASNHDAPPSVRLAHPSPYSVSSAFFILRIASMWSRGESPEPIVFTDRWVAPRSRHSRARRVHSSGPPME